MFRTLRTRLVATYVFAAIVLVVIATIGFTIFALSVFGIASRESVDMVGRAALDEARVAEARYGSLKAATPEIVEHLTRPGIGIVVIGGGGRGQFFGLGYYDGRPRFVPPARNPTAAGTNRPPWFDGRAAPDTVAPLHQPFANVQFGTGNAPGNPANPNHAAVANGGPPDAPGPGGPMGLGGPPGPVAGDRFADGSPWRGPMIDRIPPFPLGLNAFLHIDPKIVDIPGGHVRVVADPRVLISTINTAWTAMLPIGAFVVLAAWFFGRFIAGQALRPLVETTEALNRFAAGDFTPRAIVASDKNEIGELVTAYNGAVAQVNSAFEERRRVEVHMRQFVADASHELRTPLTVIMGFIDVLRRRTANEAAISGKIYDTMMAESKRMKSLIDKLIALARLENPQASPDLGDVELMQLAESVQESTLMLRPEARIELRGHPVVVRGSSHELREALSNLVDNALKYAPGQPVRIEVRAEGESALVDVADAGPGLPPKDRSQIFERFYRGQNRGETEGHGLGLAIVKRAVERAGGSISLETAPGQGCRFSIRLPRAHGEPAAIAV